MRYFLAQLAVYEAIRARLDAEWRIPRRGTLRSLPEAATLVRSPDGRVAVAVPARLCDHPAAASIIAEFRVNGPIAEITEERYLDLARWTFPSP